MNNAFHDTSSISKRLFERVDERFAKREMIRFHSVLCFESAMDSP